MLKILALLIIIPGNSNNNDNNNNNNNDKLPAQLPTWQPVLSLAALACLAHSWFTSDLRAKGYTAEIT